MTIVSFFALTGRANCVTFYQNASILVNEKEKITMSCSHDDSNLDRMLWYQQNSRTVMALIGYTYTANGEPQYEDEFKLRFQISRQGTLAGTLTISNLHQSDSAVYYCAASMHSASHLQNTLTKTHQKNVICSGFSITIWCFVSL